MMDKDTDDGSNHSENGGGSRHSLHFVSYWQLLGKIVSVFSLPLLFFTILLALKLDNMLPNWSYWVIFSPALATLLGFLLVTASQTLSGPAPPIVRVLWMVWVLAMALFTIFLIMRLENSQLFMPDLFILFSPLYIGLGLMFLVGIYLLVMGCCFGSQHTQKKYIISAAPVFCFSVVFLPLVIMISFKEGVEPLKDTVSWSVIFVPLFVADIFSFCMGFFLLIFSFGGRKDAIFSIFQLFLFLIIIPASVTFKVLLILYLDHGLDISLMYIFLPLLVLEVLIGMCGLAVIRHKKHKYLPVKIAT